MGEQLRGLCRCLRERWRGNADLMKKWVAEPTGRVMAAGLLVTAADDDLLLAACFGLVLPCGLGLGAALLTAAVLAKVPFTPCCFAGFGKGCAFTDF